MALLLAPVESPATTARLTYRSMDVTGQSKHHGHQQRLLEIQTTYQLSSSSIIESDTNQSSQGRPDGTAIGLLVQMQLNHAYSSFPKNQTSQSAFHTSTTFLHLQPHFTLEKPNQGRNRSLGSIHMFVQRSATKTPLLSYTSKPAEVD